VRTIYYPLPVRTLFDYGEFVDPVIRKGLCDVNLVEAPPATFACLRCHGIYYFSSIAADSWNRGITYLTGGMLYGREVEKPASFIRERKRARTRILNREAPVRRKVLTRLRNGWSDFQVARDLGLTMAGVGMHVVRICREERVADRYALAKKLNFPVALPQNQFERARVRREAVKEMMLTDCTHQAIMERLGISRDNLIDDVRAIYKMHGVKGWGQDGRRELAEKLGVAFVSKRDEFLKRVNEMRERGMKWREITSELGVPEGRMNSWREGVRRVERASGECVERAGDGARSAPYRE
jgi:hypothetical protein